MNKKTDLPAAMNNNLSIRSDLPYRIYEWEKKKSSWPGKES